MWWVVRGLRPRRRRVHRIIHRPRIMAVDIVVVEEVVGIVEVEEVVEGGVVGFRWQDGVLQQLQTWPRPAEQHLYCRSWIRL